MTKSMSVAAHGIRRIVPTLLVFAALGAVAVWGHRTGWRAPHFAESTDRDECFELPVAEASRHVGSSS